MVEMPDRREFSHIHHASFNALVSLVGGMRETDSLMDFLVACSLLVFFFARSPRERGRSETLHGTFFQVIKELQEWLVLVSAWEVWVFNRKEA